MTEHFPLEFLVGTWVGEGVGVYPTISPFRYHEELTFTHDGRPFLQERQVTVNLDTGLPSHQEFGFWRLVGPGTIEAVIAHHTGVTEVAAGIVSPPAQRVELRSTHLGRTPTAKLVESLERTVEVDGDTLHATLAMGAVGLPLQPHLDVTLRRQRP